MNLLDARRRAPRISLEGFCSVASDAGLHHAHVTSLSANGLRIEQPSREATTRPMIQLEIELPGIDELVWASAYVTDVRVSYGWRQWTCRTGLQIAAISSREQRLLRDYVVAQMVAHRANQPDRRVAVR
jgi:hypothetical protein